MAHKVHGTSRVQKTATDVSCAWCVCHLVAATVEAAYVVCGEEGAARSSPSEYAEPFLLKIKLHVRRARLFQPLKNDADA